MGKNNLLRKLGIGLASALSIYVGGCEGAGNYYDGRHAQITANQEVIGDADPLPESEGEFEEHDGKEIFLEDYLDKDLVFITNKDFKNSENLQRLVDYAEDKGRNVGVVDVADIDTTYSGNTTESVDNFIKDLNEQGNLEKVQIVGKQTKVPADEFEGYYSFANRDNNYADVEGDNTPELAICRFPILEESELETMVNRVVDSEESELWNNYENVFVAGADYGIPWDGYGFDGFWDEVIIPNLPDEMNVTKIYEDDENIDEDVSYDLTMELFDKINSGVFSLNYSGHGSWNRWANTNFRSTDFANVTIPYLTNSVYPIVYSASCETAMFGDQYFNSFGESMVTSPNGGAVGYIGASGLTSQVGELTKGYFEALYNSDAETLGELLLYAKKYAHENANAENSENLNNEYVCYGYVDLKIKDNK